MKTQKNKASANNTNYFYGQNKAYQYLGEMVFNSYLQGFVESYVDSLCWGSTDIENGTDATERYTIDDITRSSLKVIQRECKEFLLKHIIQIMKIDHEIVPGQSNLEILAYDLAQFRCCKEPFFGSGWPKSLAKKLLQSMKQLNPQQLCVINKGKVKKLQITIVDFKK